MLGPGKREKILKLPEVQPVDDGYRPVIAVDASTPDAGTENALNGRKTYARGTVQAIRYLDRKMKEERGKVFSMEDVLRGI